MSKDPALLFYTSDFLTGTMTMTNEQVGKYIRLLCLQHQKYILKEKDMFHVCTTYDEDIFCKFIKTSEGYYNERLRFEALKREKYCESRKKSRMFNIRGTYVGRMENENENINENEKERIVKENPNAGKFLPPTLEEVKEYCLNRKNNVDPEQFLAFYEANGWVQGNSKKPIKNWRACIITFEKNNFKRISPQKLPKIKNPEYLDNPPVPEMQAEVQKLIHETAESLKNK